MEGNATEALETASTAYDAGVECGDWQAATIACAALLRAQLNWWRFADARPTLENGFHAATKAGPHAETTLTVARALLWYALERHEDALRDLQAARTLATGTHLQPQRHRDFGPTWQRLFFLMEYMQGLVAAAGERWDEALGADALANRYAALISTPTACNAVLLARIDALLGRGAVGDVERAARLSSDLLSDDAAQSELGWSDCPALARARIAARLGSANAPTLMRAALEVLERNGRRTPLLADRAFEVLARASQDAEMKPLAHRALERSQDYRTARMSAARGPWGRVS
jgi:hypothetical protein